MLHAFKVASRITLARIFNLCEKKSEFPTNFGFFFHFFFWKIVQFKVTQKLGCPSFHSTPTNSANNCLLLLFPSQLTPIRTMSSHNRRFDINSFLDRLMQAILNDNLAEAIPAEASRAIMF